MLSVLFIVGGVKFYQELLWAESVLPKLDDYMKLLAGNPTVIVSANDKVLYRAQVEYRKPLKFEEIPQVVKDATLAAEDIRFYSHSGVDYRAAIRALFTNVKEGRVSQGGSTLTMQLAKRLYTGPERRFERKIKDMALAVQIERQHTKDQILTLYLNQVYYGAGAYGIGAAANVYFGKAVKDLTLAEAALLARLVQRPSEDNPFESPERAIENRNVVLSRMLDAGMIGQEDYEKARDEPLKLQPRHFGSGARYLRSPYFVDYVLETVKRDLPEIDFTQGGYRIETTLDTELDDLAQEKVRDVVRKYARQKLTTGAFVLMDYEGRILSMVGGADHSRNEYNVIFKGHRQPGSAFKPFVYAAALSSGSIGPNDSIPNEPIVLEEPGKAPRRWPKNANGKYGGSVSIRTAIASSINCPAVRVCQMVGPSTAVLYARDVFGFRSPLDPVLALALGSSAVTPLEMAQAYGVFMLGGDRAKPWGIRRVIGPDGEVIKEYSPEVIRNVLDPRVCAEMDGFLRAVVTGGTGMRAAVVPNARGKTGTTSDHRDAWFCGYTNGLVGIGWVASERREDGRWVYDPMNRVYGGRVTIEIWTGVMKEAVKKYADMEQARSRADMKDLKLTPPDEPPVDDVAGGDQPFPATVPPIDGPPKGDGATSEGAAKVPVEGGAPPAAESGAPTAVTVEICADSGVLATAYCPETVTRRYIRGEEPKRKCPIHGP